MIINPGDKISTNVELVRELAQGGMGSIWIGRHLSLDTDVVVKFVAEEFWTNEEIMARFAREASASAKVKSPHIVQVFDHGVTEIGIPFIVMELLQGEELAQRLATRGLVSLPELVQIVRQTCKALSKAHQAGIVHRDIKPGNIFLTDSDGDLFVKLLDFGIAKQSNIELSGMTQTGSMLGTPFYMSPEQVIDPKSVDLMTDLWALAAVVYQCLTLQVPFNGDTMGAVNIAIYNSRFELPSTVSPGLPRSIDRWFLKAFARDKATRFQSARELADAFVAAVPAEARSLRPGVLIENESLGEFPIVDVPAILGAWASEMPPSMPLSKLTVRTPAISAKTIVDSVPKRTLIEGAPKTMIDAEPLGLADTSPKTQSNPVESAPSESQPMVVRPWMVLLVALSGLILYLLLRANHSAEVKSVATSTTGPRQEPIPLTGAPLSPSSTSGAPANTLPPIASDTASAPTAKPALVKPPMHPPVYVRPKASGTASKDRGF